MSLFAHQKKIIEDDPKKTGLFLGTGASKTRISLELARGKILVVCPKTQYEDQNWQRENRKWNINKNIAVVSKEMFRRDFQKLPRFDTVIVDEAHTCLGVTPNTRQRNKQLIPKTSQLFEALEWYVSFHKPERFYLATATIMRSPMTVWGAARLLGYDWNFYEFREAFYIRLPMPGRMAYKARTDSAAKDRLARAVRKIGYVGRLEDFFDVPEQTYKTIHCPLTARQAARIKDMTTEYPEPIVRVGKIHQIENGVLAGDEFNRPESFITSKIDAILDLAEEFGQLIVFAKFTAQVEAIRAAMEKAGKKALVLTGATKDRGRLIAEANAAKECVFIVQAQISAGWELPEYPCMVFASMTYSFVDRIQAEGRIQRANNIKKNLYVDLVSGAVDRAVQECIRKKKDFDERIYAEDL